MDGVPSIKSKQGRVNDARNKIKVMSQCRFEANS